MSVPFGMLPESEDRHMPFSLITSADMSRFRVSTSTVQIVARADARVAADRRWAPALRMLRGLHKRGRRSIRIVHASCGDGTLLIHAARAARSLGFTAIEGHGVDRDPALVAAARLSAALVKDPAIGLTFEAGDGAETLTAETEFPADLVFYADDSAASLAALARAAGVASFAGPGFIKRLAA
jgi:hypothetical protein